ncbi:DoxX family protein [Acidisoma sp. 7E03]
MIQGIVVWLLVAGFAGAGLFNLIGTERTRGDFVRWGYPRWWGVPTGLAEILSAALIALPATRAPGLGLGAAIILAATVSVLRQREARHLPPLGLFAVLIVLAAALP